MLVASNLQLTTALPQRLVPVLQVLRGIAEELVGDGAIDDAVIVAERDMADAADGDRVLTVLIGHHDGLLLYRANAEDRGLRLHDDRQAEFLSELPRVGDGES